MSVIRLEKLLFPPMGAMAANARQMLRHSVPGINIFETYRTPTRQNELYAQGRTAPGSIVTSAQAWASWHQYGLACDIAVRSDDGLWSWDFDKELVKEAFLAAGFEPGAAYEFCHYQLTGGLKLSEAREIAFTDGLLAVWHRVDALISAKP